MQILIDTKTVLLASFILNIFLILLLVLYRMNQKTEKSTKMFMRAKVFQVLAFAVWCLNILLPLGGIAWSQFACSELLMVAIFFECIAVMLLINSLTRRAVTFNIAMLIVFSALFMHAYFVNTTQFFRIILFAVFASALIVYPLVLLFKSKSDLKMQRAAGTIYLLMMVCFVLRGLVAGGAFTEDVSRQDQIQSWILFSLFVLMILANCVYLFLTKVRADMKLMQLANCDELTNILNRRAFNEISDRAIQYCARKNEPVTFMIFDIDGFKKVNDSFGHYVGDTVLEEVASIVQSQIRAYDFFGRYGGDEFALLLPGTTGEEASAVAERLLRSIELRTVYKHTKLRVTVSMGMISLVPTSDTSMETLYQLADGALYDAKQAGGNCVMPPVQIIWGGGHDGEKT